MNAAKTMLGGKRSRSFGLVMGMALVAGSIAFAGAVRAGVDEKDMGSVPAEKSRAKAATDGRTGHATMAPLTKTAKVEITGSHIPRKVKRAGRIADT